MTESRLLLYVCADGHTWTDQGDGTVSPSYGYGGTRLTWPGYDPQTCPEPERHESGWGYVCVCGERWYTGGCGCKRWRPPKPVCLKPPLYTFEWRDHTRTTSGGWYDVTPQRDLFHVEPFEQVGDAIRILEIEALEASCS